MSPQDLGQAAHERGVGVSETLDLEYLVAWSLERQQKADRTNRLGGDRCRRCGHRWHGMWCGVEADTGVCLCESAWEPADGLPPASTR